MPLEKPQEPAPLDHPATGRLHRLMLLDVAGTPLPLAVCAAAAAALGTIMALTAGPR